MKNKLVLTSICLAVGIVAGFIGGYKLKSALDARKAQSYFSEGKQLYDQQKYPGAVEKLNRSIALDPSLSSAHMLLAGSYQSQGWNELAEKELQAGGGQPPREPGQQR